MINAKEITAALEAKGITTRIASTGGGVYTLYAGATHPTGDHAGAAVGPFNADLVGGVDDDLVVEQDGDEGDEFKVVRTVDEAVEAVVEYAGQFWCSPNDIKSLVEDMDEVVSYEFMHSGGGCGTVYINADMSDEWDGGNCIMVGPFHYGSPFSDGARNRHEGDISVGAYGKDDGDDLYSSCTTGAVESFDQMRAAILAACAALAAFRAKGGAK
jgi:hypothetical protein